MTPLATPAMEAVAIAAMTAGTISAVQRLSRTGSAVPHAQKIRVSAAQPILAVVAGISAWAVTGWPAAGAWAAIGGWAIPRLSRRDRARALETARLDAWATWVALIAGQLAGQASLAEALLAACRRAPAALESEIGPLADTLAGLPLDEALTAWAVDGEGSSELRQVRLVLGLAASGAGGHVSQVLALLASQLRARAGSARRVERERRRTRLAGRAAAAVAVLWVAVGARSDATLFGVYRNAGGQVLLAALLGIMAAGLWGLARLDRGLT